MDFLNREILAWSLIIVLATATAYYMFTARLYNSRENSLKRQLKNATVKYWALASAAQSVVNVADNTLDPYWNTTMIVEIQELKKVLKRQEADDN